MINKKKILKITFIVILILFLLNILNKIVYNNFYLNGNNDTNIKRSILNLQYNNINNIENISIIEKIQLQEMLLVIYKNKFNLGIAQFNKNLWGNYKLTLLQPGRLEAINFYKPININDENKFLIVYGDVSNRDISRIDIEVSNHSIPINISSKIFAECIPTDQYFDTATYFTYKCYDHYGNLIKDL